MNYTLNIRDLNRDSLTDEIVQMVQTIGGGELKKLVSFFGAILQNDPDHLDALYGYGMASLRLKNLDHARYHFRRALHRAPGNKLILDILSLTCLAMGAYEEAYGHARDLLPHKLDDPKAYALLHLLCKALGKRDELIGFRGQMAAHCVKGYHFQDTWAFSLRETAPDLYAETSPRAPPKPRARKRKKTVTPANAPAQAVSGDATPVGNEGMTLNGTVGGSNLPTRYFFRYGTAPGNLDRTTADRDVPPGRHGRVADTAANPFWRIYAHPFQAYFRKIEKGDKPPGPETDVSVVLRSPFAKDRNHINGIGIIDLVFLWLSAAHVRDRVGGDYAGGPYPWKTYPGESLDLRDAEFSVVLRSNDLDARDFRVVAWIHAGTGTSLMPHHMEDMAPWALTAGLESTRIVADNEWRELTFRFRGNSNDWSFAGNNVEELGPEIGRYLYHPLGESLGSNRGNICLCFIGGNDLDTPEGEIDLASLSLRYRGRSLLGPGFGGELLKAPDNGSDPAALSEGWIGNEAYYWQSAPNPSRAQEFTWKFADRALIESVRLHQNPRWPAKKIEVSTSTNGKKFSPLWSAELRVDGAGAMGGPEPGPPREPNNLASMRIFDKPVKATHFRLRILSGYFHEHWGLDAVEVFGQGPRPIPETEPCSVSEELTGLPPGTEVFYQLVAENGKGTSAGAVKSLVLPADAKPIIHWAKVIERTRNKATVLARVTAMGSFAELRGTLANSKGKTVYQGSVTAGKWQTPRHVILPMTGLTAKGKFKASLTAANETGKSAPLVVEIAGGA